jgi:hypothetical protein
MQCFRIPPPSIMTPRHDRPKAGHVRSDAVAATCLALKLDDVICTADDLATRTHPAQVINRLLRVGPDMLAARQAGYGTRLVARSCRV